MRWYSRIAQVARHAEYACRISKGKADYWKGTTFAISEAKACANSWFKACHGKPWKIDSLTAQGYECICQPFIQQLTQKPVQKEPANQQGLLF